MNGDINGLNGTNTGISSAAMPTEKDWPGSPVARVNSVAPGSPAAESVSFKLPSCLNTGRAVWSGPDGQGLQVGDLIHSFAGVETDGGLQAIGAVVQRSEGVRSEHALGCHADDDTGRIGASSHAKWQQENA
jgi:hypothetical protein